jgi:hypothetical protein
VGIQSQARAGELGFLTFEEIQNDSKDKKILYILKSSVSWKTLVKSKGGSIRFSDIQKYLT